MRSFEYGKFVIGDNAEADTDPAMPVATARLEAREVCEAYGVPPWMVFGTGISRTRKELWRWRMRHVRRLVRWVKRKTKGVRRGVHS